jgi:hypothetical protein
MIFKPRLHGICQVHGLTTKMNPGQTARAFKVLDHVSVVFGMADLWDTQESDELFLCHDTGTRNESTICVRQDCQYFKVLLHAVHDLFLDSFFGYRPKWIWIAGE